MAEIATVINSQCHQCIYSNTNSDAEWIPTYRKLCRSVNLSLELGSALPELHPYYPAIHPRVLELVAEVFLTLEATVKPP